MMPDGLRRWPLLALGLTVIMAGVALVDRTDTSDARAFLLGVGAVLTGAGVVLVVWQRPDPPNVKIVRSKTRHTEETDDE